jgi:hypothetical protein
MALKGDALREYNKYMSGEVEQSIAARLQRYNPANIKHYGDVASRTFLEERLPGLDHLVLCGDKAVLLQDKYRKKCDRKEIGNTHLDMIIYKDHLEKAGFQFCGGVLVTKSLPKTPAEKRSAKYSGLCFVGGTDDVEELSLKAYITVCHLLRLIPFAASCGDVEMAV